MILNFIFEPSFLSGKENAIKDVRESGSSSKNLINNCSIIFSIVKIGKLR